ncbi:hypothetical protein A3K55_01840 [Candidatus Shapirobacteria bacterium RBG_13_44_7]|uniref:DUF4115 domain-containing protein n=1 Tax=Candidatus Shapirobacteria bacterium RBG_13_44_7 TaxID=1802149 RepID=A0A1F7SKT8_9BACT|nr:MAG: hypothetical protein A3K55_01840 [Candidatus Shapirobacteria bacterium RBG_13_44_7]
MHRASTILKTTRLDKELNLDEISKKTKIPTKYLEAIELEDIQNLPDEPYCSLIVKDYADSLGLNGQNILSIFRRDVLTRKKYLSGSKKTISITPQLSFAVVVVSVVIIFSAYLLFEYVKFNSPPHLEVKWPEKNNNPTLEITGTTDLEATVRINGDLVIVDAEGKFSKSVNIGNSETKISVESQARGGQSTTDQRVYK